MLGDSEILCSFCRKTKQEYLKMKEKQEREGLQYIYCFSCGAKTRLKIARNHESHGHLYCTNCYELVQIEKEKEIRKNLREMIKREKVKRQSKT